MKGIRTILFFITIFFAVIIGFIILKLTNNYFLWIISVVIATLFIGIINSILLKILKKKLNKHKKK